MCLDVCEVGKKVELDQAQRSTACLLERNEILRKSFELKAK